MRDTERYRRLCSIADPATWPSALQEAIESGEFIFWRHYGDWIVLLSVKKGDTVLVESGGSVQARLAVHLHTGEVRHPTPGIPIGEWEAELAGLLEEYRQRQADGLTRPFIPEEWERGGSDPGRPFR